MKVVSQVKTKVVVELSPVELELIKSGLVRERNYRRQQWEKVNPKFPEELMYHAVLKDTSEDLSTNIFKVINTFRDWGVLK